MAKFTVLMQDIRVQDGLYSLNDLHKAAGAEKRHSPRYWARTQQAKKRIAKLTQSGHIPIQQNQQRGTWACQTLVYAYALWISPRFHQQVTQAFEHLSQTDTRETYQTLNRIAQSMGIAADAVILPTNDVMGLVSLVRHYQQLIASIQTHIPWADDSIERIKHAAGRSLGDC